jgi:hypothetical protein
VSVSKPDSCLLNTGQSPFGDFFYFIDFQHLKEVGIPLEMYLACRGRLVKTKTHNHFKNNFMKQSILNAALVLACVITLPAMNSFAAGPVNGGGNKEIRASFAHDFQSAQLVSTEDRDTYTKVVFKLNQQVMTAFYSHNGDLMAVTRNLVSSQLPVSLLMSFKKHYSEYWITDLFEMSQDQQSSYYLTMENSDSRITLRSDGDEWEVYSTIKK